MTRDPDRWHAKQRAARLAGLRTRAELAAEAQRRLESAVRAAMEARGEDRLTVADIAAAAGISVSTAIRWRR